MIDIQTLDIGVGEKPRGTINIDLIRTPYCNLIADIQNLPFKENVFHRILCSQVLEHLNDPVKSIKEIKRVLKPKGLVLIDFPKPHFINNMMYRFIELFTNLPFSLFPRHLKIIFKSITGVKQHDPRWYHKHIITVKLVSKQLRILEVSEFGDLFLKELTKGRKAKWFRNKPKLNTGVLVKCTK